MRCSKDSKKFCLSLRKSRGDFNTLGIVFFLRRVIRVDNSKGLIHISREVEFNEGTNSVSMLSVGEPIWI